MPIDRDDAVVFSEDAAARTEQAVRWVEGERTGHGFDPDVDPEAISNEQWVLIASGPIQTDTGIVYRAIYLDRDESSETEENNWVESDVCTAEELNGQKLVNGKRYKGRNTFIALYGYYYLCRVVVSLPPWDAPHVMTDCINGVPIMKYIQIDGTLTDNKDGTNNP